MAYLRKEKEIVEMDYPIAKVWEVVLQAITNLEWTAEDADEKTHKVKAKTKGAFLSYSSTLSIDVVSKGEGTTRVYVSAETPVTMVTGLIDFGRTQERIDVFLGALTVQLDPEGLNQKSKAKRS